MKRTTMADMGTAAVVADLLADDSTATKNGMTRERYVAAVREIAAAFVGGEAAQLILGAKLVYGVGSLRGARGICYYSAWKNGSPSPVAVIEVCAQHEESLTQIAGTTIHECAHVLAGPGAGHGPEWKAACGRLGLTIVEAAGQAYAPEHFEPSIWNAIAEVPVPTDGAPVFGIGAGLPISRPRPCPLGIGTRGGKSRGAGSGSRLRLWVCGCPEGTIGRKVRVASDDWDTTCNKCSCKYERAAR